MTYAGCLPSTSASNVATTRTFDLIRPLRQFSAVADDTFAEESGLQLLLAYKQLWLKAGASRVKVAQRVLHLLQVEQSRAILCKMAFSAHLKQATWHPCLMAHAW